MRSVQSRQAWGSAHDHANLIMSQLAGVAVILLNWNGLSETLECIHSLLDQDYANFIIFVVDNGSFEDPEAAVADLPRTTLIKAGSNLGFCRGNNLAIETAAKANFKYCWILNNDTIVEPDALRILVEFLERSPGCNAVTNRINYADDRKSCWFSGGIICAGVPSHRVDLLGHPKPDANAGKTDFLSGCSFLSKTQTLMRLGGFDANYFCYMEDVDLSLRIKALGGDLGYTDEAIVYHKVSRSTGHRSPLKVYYKTRNFIYFCRKFSLGTRVLVNHFARSARLFLTLLIKNHDIKAAASLLRGIYDGLVGRTGGYQ